jgi:acetyl-CoA carboxylase biotin carboxyl carrier protein
MRNSLKGNQVRADYLCSRCTSSNRSKRACACSANCSRVRCCRRICALAAAGFIAKSPMVGTFYRAANPESPNFVNVGDIVTVGQTLCIIEAMKLLNEIESEKAGVIKQILCENGQGVEYDQPLFVIA